MKSNYIQALKKAQIGLPIKPPKRAQMGIVPPPSQQRGSMIKAQSQIETVETPVHRPTPNPELIAASSTSAGIPHEGMHVPQTNTSVIPDNSTLRQRSWLGTLGTKIGNIFRPDHRDLNPHGTYVDLESRKNIPTYRFNLGDGAYVDPTSDAGTSLYMKKGGGVGSSNYMKALKTAKKGGSKR